MLYIVLLIFPLLKLWGPESIHNIYNVPLELEPERAAKARRAVVASQISKRKFLQKLMRAFDVALLWFDMGIGKQLPIKRGLGVPLES